MDYLLAFGLLAGLAQANGYYIYYVRVILRDGKEAEPLTWLMFGYGTLLLTIMEFDSMYTEAIESGNWLEVVAILLLPIICSAGAVSITAFTWWQNYQSTRTWWPKAWRLEWRTKSGVSFGIDLILTSGYIGLWILTAFIIQSGELHQWGVILFVLISNATTIPGFVPILIKTYHEPNNEDSSAWFVWALAYALLTVPVYVYASEGVVWPLSIWFPTWDQSFWYFLALMSYPVPNAVFHFAVGVLATPSRQRRSVAKPAE